MYLYAINGATGALKWRYLASGIIKRMPAVHFSDESIVFGCEDGYVYRISSVGTLLWRYFTNYAVPSAISISPAGLILYGDGDGSCLAVIPQNT